MTKRKQLKQDQLIYEKYLEEKLTVSLPSACMQNPQTIPAGRTVVLEWGAANRLLL